MYMYHHVHRTCACSRRQRPNCLPMMSFSGGIGQLVALFHGWTPFKELHVLGQPSTLLLTAVVTGCIYGSVRSAMYDQLLPTVKCLLAIPLQHRVHVHFTITGHRPITAENARAAAWPLLQGLLSHFSHWLRIPSVCSNSTRRCCT